MVRVGTVISCLGLEVYDPFTDGEEKQTKKMRSVTSPRDLEIGVLGQSAELVLSEQAHGQLGKM